ncbi:hypothetical protein CPT_Summit_080 [Stenotrophomonas phage Summit]|nr:hypothetical protein CPT_Summit_080 [Stenotrophomonas phage Summit]
MAYALQDSDGRLVTGYTERGDEDSFHTTTLDRSTGSDVPFLMETDQAFCRWIGEAIGGHRSFDLSLPLGVSWLAECRVVQVRVEVVR